MTHYFDPEPTTPSEPRHYEIDFDGRRFLIHSDRGVFSHRRLDDGSRLLLEAVTADLRADGQHEGELLDLGCGVGVLGIVLKRVFPGFALTLTDVNERALELTRTNLEENGIRYATVLASDGWEAQVLTKRHFDVIVTNPPIRAGKQTVLRLLDGAADHLSPTGRLYLVIGKKQGAPSYARHLETRYSVVDRIARQQGFAVYRCQKGEPT
ncbi:MAG: methyltransferase [Bacillota bacterium]|nr:methyltransferase [Bacillota bacterium]